MSDRARLPRKSASSTLSYADAHTSSSESEDGESVSGGGAARGRKGRGPSKRAKGKAKALEGDDEDEGDEDEAPRKKARKGRKGAAKGPKKGEGKLEVLKTLPVELLVEIFSHLDPNDLLALSMVNKEYRALLLAKASARLWKDARERLDLPDATAGGFTEWQYAQLVFGKHCQCGALSIRHADFGVRKRLCKRCREASIIRLDWKKNNPPRIHRRAKDCVLRALHSPANVRWQGGAPFGLVDDLQYFSNKLWDLEFADDVSSGGDEADSSDDDDATRAPALATSRGRRALAAIRPARGTKRRSIYREVSSDDEESGGSRRADTFIAARKMFIEQVKREGEAMCTAAEKLHRELQERKSNERGVPFSVWSSQMDRADEVMERVLELDLGYCESDFTSTFFKHELVMREKPLTDEEWERIKPAVLKLLARIKRKQQKDAIHERLRSRRAALRPRYDELKQSLPASARPFVPLFVDFLLLPSVKPFWEDEDEVSDALWYGYLDEVKEDLRQFRLDLALRARELIVAATWDPDDDGVDQDEAAVEDEPDLSDAFFARATSFVCCAFSDCDKIPDPYSGAASVRPHTKGFIGPLDAVLAHQHRAHNEASHLPSPKQFNGEPQLRLSLPLEVACAVGAVVEFTKIDPEKATLADLVRFDKLVAKYVWDNATSWKRNFYVGRWQNPQAPGWEDLLYAIKVEADRAAKAKPPLSLDPPVIVCHLRNASDWGRLPLEPPPEPPVREKKKKAKAVRVEQGAEGDEARVKKEEESDEDGTKAFWRDVVLDSEDDA
ncbi:hypothetical protein JCM10449v2_006493 [Rhodotorula kratochvilovae]